MGETTETEREIVATFSARVGMDWKKTRGLLRAFWAFFLGGAFPTLLLLLFSASVRLDVQREADPAPNRGR